MLVSDSYHRGFLNPYRFDGIRSSSITPSTLCLKVRFVVFVFLLYHKVFFCCWYLCVLSYYVKPFDVSKGYRLIRSVIFWSIQYNFFKHETDLFVKIQLNEFQYVAQLSSYNYSGKPRGVRIQSSVQAFLYTMDKLSVEFTPLCRHTL